MAWRNGRGRCASALPVGLCYLSGEYSANRVRLVRDDGTGAGVLRITGGLAPDAERVMRRTARRLAADFRRRGSMDAAGLGQDLSAGAESHYGATAAGATGRVRFKSAETVGRVGLFLRRRGDNEEAHGRFPDQRQSDEQPVGRTK